VILLQYSRLSLLCSFAGPKFTRIHRHEYHSSSELKKKQSKKPQNTEIVLGKVIDFLLHFVFGFLSAWLLLDFKLTGQLSQNQNHFLETMDEPPI
jgi:hypothetical protein